MSVSAVTKGNGNDLRILILAPSGRDAQLAHAWLAVCRLAAATAENQNAVNHDEPTKVVNIGPLWSVALDRAQAPRKVRSPISSNFWSWP